jgi:hypothetical protein
LKPSPERVAIHCIREIKLLEKLIDTREVILCAKGHPPIRTEFIDKDDTQFRRRKCPKCGTTYIAPPRLESFF